jgi:3-phenylpropionate/trans-cinnamate dioxygenase ferredoxin component
MSDWVNVAHANELTAGSWRSVDLDGTMVAVFNLDGEYHAIEDLCTHDGGILSGGMVDRDEIVCPRHGAHFSIKTGKALTPPAYEDVATFPVRVHQGVVQIRDPRWD